MNTEHLMKVDTQLFPIPLIIPLGIRGREVKIYAPPGIGSKIFPSRFDTNEPTTYDAVNLDDENGSSIIASINPAQIGDVLRV